MNFVILKNSFNSLGGLEKQTLHICNYLLQKGYKVTLITNKINNDEILKNINLVVTKSCFKKAFFFTFLKILYFDLFTARWIKKYKPNIVLGIDRTSNQTHIRAGNGVHRAFLEKKKRYLKRSFLLDKLNPLNWLILKIEKKSFENPLLKKIIVNSQMVKDEILKYYAVSPSKILMIHNGTEWEKYEQPFLESFQIQQDLKKRFNIDPNRFTFLFVGNGYKRKGADLLIKAASLIDMDFHIIFIGKEKRINKYEKLANSLNVNKITFLGYQTDLVSYYQMADCFILPTIYDPFSNVILEALSMGLYSITSKENGAHEIINEQNGAIIKNFNIDEIANLMKLAIRCPKEKKRALMIRESIKNLTISSQIEKVYRALIHDGV